MSNREERDQVAEIFGHRLFDAIRPIGIERGIDLVLLVLYSRWTSLSYTGHSDWQSILRAVEDGDLAQRLRESLKEDAPPFMGSESLDFPPEVLRAVVQIVAEIGGSAPSDQAMLTSTFEAVIQRLESIGFAFGETATPVGLASLLVSLTVRPDDIVLDPAVGVGNALLVAGRTVPGVRALGIEINQRVAARAAMRFEIAGVEGEVRTGDALKEQLTNVADAVIAQPPWGLVLNDSQKSNVEELIRNEGWHFKTSPTRGDLPWILVALAALKPGGRAAVVVRESAGVGANRDVLERLVRQGSIEAILSLPGGTFSHTSIRTAIWVLREGSNAGNLFLDVLMVNAATALAESGPRSMEFTTDGTKQLLEIVRRHREGVDIEAPAHVARSVPVADIEVDRGMSPGHYLDPVPPEVVAHPSPERRLLTQISLKNFKAFGGLTEIDLAPLTLVYGANSAGKSSILQSLLLLKQSVDSDFLITQGAITDVGGFRGVTHLHQSDSIEFGLTYGVIPDWVPAAGTPDPRSLRSAKWTFEGQSDGRGRLASLDLAFGEYRLPFTTGTENEPTFEIRLDDVGEVMRGISSGTLLYPFDSRHRPDDDEADAARRLRSRVQNGKRAVKTLRNRSDGLELSRSGMAVLGEARVDLIGLVGRADRDESVASSYANRLARLAAGVSTEIRALLLSVVWLGPLRSAPQRFYDRSSTEAQQGDGRHVAMYLFDNATVLEQVNEWMRALEIPYELDVQTVGAGSVSSLIGDLVAVALTDRRSGVRVTPADVGFGISQVLPIVVELLSRRDSIIFVEQPETHLHPRLQSRLADLFIESTQEGGRANQMIVETHSEHLLLRIQRRIREGELDPAHVSILYVDQDPDGNTSVQSLRLNSDGEFLDEWPHGFFDERLEELFGEI
jgi:tRNA1(Val) A37 N6-methylase TrmN6